MTKPPIVSFVPWHPSRIVPLRSWRERDLLEAPKKKTRVKFREGTSNPKKATGKRSEDEKLLALLPPGVDPKLQRAVLEALRKVK